MKKPVVIAIIAICVLLVGATAYVIFSNMSGSSGEKGVANNAHPTEAKKVPKEKTLMMAIEPSFITNIKNSGRYVKVNITLEAKEEKSKEEIEHSMPKIKDTIIAILRDKTEQFLLSNDAQEELKVEIKEGLHSKLELEDVLEVLINEFLIQ